MRVKSSRGCWSLSKPQEMHAQLVDNGIYVFNNIIRCVMQAEAEFCHSIRPKLFLLNSPATPACLDDDHLFAMSDVERVLMSPKRKQWVLSVSGRQQMERSKLVNLLQLSHWNNLFPIDFVPVQDYLQEVVQELQNLGLSLDIPWSKLQAIKKNCPTVEEQRMELVSVWMSSSANLHVGGISYKPLRRRLTKLWQRRSRE